jgi:hypothetical protein
MSQDTSLGTLRLHLAHNGLVDYQYVRALSYQLYGGASTGECLRVAQLIRQRGDSRDSWVQSWTEQGQLSQRLGEQALARGHRETARAFFLRAYNYLRAAEFFFDRKRDGAQAHRDLYRQSVASFDAAMHLADRPVEKIAIPYLEGIFLPGYFFKVSASAKSVPTIIICGGGDSFGEESYFTAGVPEALARGMQVVVFHGPGQRGLLHEHPDAIFRPDYEVPISKVIEYVLSRPDVNAERLGLYGYSFGGYLAPRAAAFDPRIKALVANAFIRNAHELLLSGLLSQFPGALRPLAAHEVGPLVRLAMRKDWGTAALVAQSMLWPSGTTTVDEYLDRLRAYTLSGLEQRIRCPVLCVSAAGEGEVAGTQARQVFEALTCPKTFMTLTEELGADNHVGLNNITYTAGLIFDWFRDVFADQFPPAGAELTA